MGLEPTASLVLSQGGLPIAYRAMIADRSQCPRQESNLQTFGFKPNRSAVGVPGRSSPGRTRTTVGLGVGRMSLPLDHGTDVSSSGLTGNRTRISRLAEPVSSCWTMSPLQSKRKPWDSNPQAAQVPPPVFKTGSSSGRMTSVDNAFKSSGGWNRTNGLLVQSQASLPTATAPDRVVSRHSCVPEFGEKDSNLHHLVQSQAAYR